MTAGVSVALSMTSASAATSVGSCSKDGYYANYSVSYHYSGGYDYIDSYNWTIGKGGSRNNVEARTKADKNFGRQDPIYDTWISGDNIRAGSGTHKVGNGVKVPGNEKMYVEFKFTFDKPNSGDPKCEGHTRNV
ncbi:MAG: hypothetical protein ACRDRU_25185 [Pseudonocardiaceae bacterium]